MIVSFGPYRKYGNRKVELDGYIFDSGAEARRYQELELLERAGEIQSLVVHPKFALVVNGYNIGTYIADFRYQKCSEMAWTVEDVKGVKTPVYRLKKKLMKALFGIEVKEIP